MQSFHSGRSRKKDPRQAPPLRQEEGLKKGKFPPIGGGQKLEGSVVLECEEQILRSYRFKGGVPRTSGTAAPPREKINPYRTRPSKGGKGGLPKKVKAEVVYL